VSTVQFCPHPAPFVFNYLPPSDPQAIVLLCEILCETSGLPARRLPSLRAQLCQCYAGRSRLSCGSHDRESAEGPQSEHCYRPPLKSRNADMRLMRDVPHLFVQAVFASLRRRARDSSIRRAQCGAVTFAQRFGGSLRLKDKRFFIVHLTSSVLICAARSTPRSPIANSRGK
jgi:hypothetical protein